VDVNLFARGSLYWYYNKNTKKEDYGKPEVNQDFITNRPVVIVSEKCDELNDVIVALCTTSHNRSGIVFETFNYSRTAIIRSTCMPYKLKNVHTDFLVNYQGIVSKAIMEQITIAINYHLGMSDIKPAYEHCPEIKKYYPIPLHGIIMPDALKVPNDNKMMVENTLIHHNVNTLSAIISVKEINDKTHALQSASAMASPKTTAISDKDQVKICESEADKEEVSIEDGEKEKQAEKDLTSSLTSALVDNIPIGKLQQLKTNIRLQRQTMQIYLDLEHEEKLALAVKGTIKDISTKYNIAYYTAQKILELLKLDFKIDRKEFLEFAKQDKHKLQFLTKKQQDILKYISDEDIITIGGIGKYSENYLENTRERYQRKSA